MLRKYKIISEIYNPKTGRVNVVRKNLRTGSTEHTTRSATREERKNKKVQ